MSVWLLCALLFSLIGQTEQDGHPVPIEEVKVYSEETASSDCGAWVLNVTWRDKFAENNESEKVSYDIEVLRTEQMRTVHFETIHVMPDKTSYHWKWTSPIPLQCTSHSVRLRRHNEHHIGEWTPLYTHKGRDLNAATTTVYPHDQVFVVGSNITFCCIVETDKVPLSGFLIRISNRTYITKPVPFERPYGPNIHCDVEGDPSGSTIFIGYPPDDQNLTCITRNLSSLECHWETGRNTHLTGIRKTKYTLNGRVCEFGKCVIHAVKKQVTNWTLIAKNPLGVKTLTDTADPTQRVWLRAPSKIAHVAYARKVTFRWSWNEENYALFPMICQAKLNGIIYNKTFNGVGLSSVVLINLQPFAKYTAQVQCGSYEHFYKWGDWSEITKFSTKEDIPEAVDVWIHYSEQTTSVLWKPLTEQQSHGIITGYEITIGKTNKELKTQLCYNITSGNEKSDGIITVSAKNSAGRSPPSTIIVPTYPDNEVDISHISSSNGGFKMSWEEYPYSTCGYVVEWFPTYKKTQCAVAWEKIPKCDSGACETWNQSGIFEAGVRYTVSVYACTDDSPKLLKRSEGYAIEKQPGKVEKLEGENKGRNVELSWAEVHLEQQNGFIRGYKVITLLSGSETSINMAVTKEPKVNLKLDPGSYTFRVSAFTSGGEGDYATFKMNVEKSIDQMIAATIVGCSAATLVFIIITVLCYRKRKWLKKLLYPDIPKPKLAGKWITKGIYCTQMTEGYMKCEIQEVHSLEHPAISESLHGLDLISSNSKVVPAQHFYQNISESPADVSYCPVEKLTSIIENPSYNMTIPEPVGVAQISDLTVEMQDAYLPAPNFVQNNFVVKDSDGYKPQSASPTNA
ncbi:leukemia inhibitory factor receptor-like isoform X1 [Sinocyclocheilus rhinocerous]|uniref:Leukemia inhibitory factor receptor-like n=1 Tax=Sinocyclocheilus rhinocerous TaxID=307959 RepID=A0A673N198_9TELE|nr:PREDICTED: leukemia inhibitory factor receptor-like isoform X1 [Sinocyclocheilus rhinocerous]